ncbi:MAG: hypothetical protein VXY92_09715 [Planctomycetota bacterium]|nr:hypothetical protein [Planctomycetota bacterium]
MTCNPSRSTGRPAAHAWIPACAALLLASCELDTNQQQTATADPNPGPTAPTVNASAVANGPMRAEVIGSNTTVPSGTPLSGVSFSVENAGMPVPSSEHGTAGAMFDLVEDSATGTVTFTVEEEAFSFGSNAIGTVGEHQAMITLFTTEPVAGTLTIQLSGVASSLAGSGWTMADIGNDAIFDWQSGMLNDLYQQPLTVDGDFEIRLSTYTNADALSNVLRTVTVQFTPQ